MEEASVLVNGSFLIAESILGRRKLFHSMATPMEGPL